jgi:serine/threonine protein kinase
METPLWVGKYEIEQFLGGGMSHVFRARDSVLGRRVALKMLTDKAMADPQAKARFLEEARTASNLRHESIISVYDFGEDQGRPFMVMEFLEGESLRDAILHDSLGKVERRLGIAVQIGRAIDYIHARKIVHRDIKPENVHVDLTGRAKLMDFGIAKNGHQPDAASTEASPVQPGLTLGTPYYMAPEQVLGRPLTPHADIYAFGVMLYEILTGMKAVTADSVEKIFQQVIYEPLKLEPLAASGVPVPVIALIGRCASKQMVQRPPNLGVVCDEIERVLKQEPGSQEKPAPVAAGHTAMEVPLQAPPAPVPNAASVHFTPDRGGTAVVPGVLQRLPKEMQSPVSLMILACGGVVFFAMLLYALLIRLRVI